MKRIVWLLIFVAFLFWVYNLMGQDLDTWKVKQETKLNLTIQMETKTIMLLQLEIKETEQERDNKYDIPTKKMIAQLSDELAKGTAQLAKLNR